MNSDDAAHGAAGFAQVKILPFDGEFTLKNTCVAVAGKGERNFNPFGDAFHGQLPYCLESFIGLFKFLSMVTDLRVLIGVEPFFFFAKVAIAQADAGADGLGVDAGGDGAAGQVFFAEFNVRLQSGETAVDRTEGAFYGEGDLGAGGVAFPGVGKRQSGDEGGCCYDKFECHELVVFYQ